MRGSNTAGWRAFDPETGRTTPSSGGTPRQQNAPFGNPRPKSAYEYFKENMKSQGPASPNSTKKRNGFAPGTAGGDEPMARNTSAYTNTRSERPSSMYFESAPPPTAKKPAAPDPPLSEEPQRFSTSYATTGGEKTFFTSAGLGRSSTRRTPSESYKASNSRTSPPSPVHGHSGRHRSASPKDRRNKTYSLSTSSSDLDSETDEEVVEVPRPSSFKPKAVPKSRLRPNQKFAEFYRHENSSSGTGEEPFTRQNTKDSRPAPRPANNGFRRPRKPPAFVDLTADSDGNQGHNSDSAAFPRGSYRPESQTQFPDLGAQYALPQLSGPVFSDLYFRYRTNSGQHTAGPQPTAFGRHSSGNLHKKFSAEDWREHINAFDFLGAAAKHRSSNENQRSGRTTNRTDSAQSGTSGSPGLNPFGSVPGAQPRQQQTPTPFAQAKFSADQWAEKLRDISWNAQETDKSRQSANTPPTRSPKKQARSGTKVRSTPQPASVASEAEEARETVNGVPPEPSRSVPADAEAMDIDEPPAPPASAPVPETASTGIPSYPDLNAHVAQDPPSASKKTNPQPPRTEGSTTTETRTPLFDLENLRKTAPFTSTNSSGIENLEDVHATLPFESRAKQPTTTKRDIRPRDLKLPNPPKRPWAPQPLPIYPGSSQLALPRDKWKYYVSAMGTYMHEWNLFNRRMLLHFNSRQEAIETGLAPGWISAVGDTNKLRVNGADEDGDGDKSEIHEDADINESDDSLVPGGKGGFSAYLRGIEEDVKVRKHWEVACELHRECILDLGRLREWIRNGGKVV